MAEVQLAGRAAEVAGAVVHAAAPKQHRDAVGDEVAAGEGALRGAGERQGKKHDEIRMILSQTVQESMGFNVQLEILPFLQFSTT